MLSSFEANQFTRAADDYPGAKTTTGQLLALADEYRGAAMLTLSKGRRGHPWSWAPGRLLAIQAIELYLNAVLMDAGMSASAIRGLQHDLARRARIAVETGFVLRLKTRAHLHLLAHNREYLTARYGPELCDSWSEVTRLCATLNEVGTKAEARVRR